MYTYMVQHLVGMQHKKIHEMSVVLKGLPYHISHTLRTIFEHLNNNPLFRVLDTEGSFIGDNEISVDIARSFMSLLLFCNANSELKDCGTGFLQLIEFSKSEEGIVYSKKICALYKREKSYKIGSFRSAARSSKLNDIITTIEKSIFSKSTWEDMEVGNKMSMDLLAVMSNFDVDDSNTIRLAEFINSYRMHRISRTTHLHGYYPDIGSPEAWDRRLLKIGNLFFTIKPMNPTQAANMISRAWKLSVKKKQKQAP